MTEFIQLHLLTSFPPANLNRDDVGRPKTAVMGGAMRLRISSQSLKRAWRTSDLFQEALANHVGTRTRRLGQQVLDELTRREVKEDLAKKATSSIASVFGKLGADNVNIRQLVHVSPEEIEAVHALVAVVAEEKRVPREEELKLLRHSSHAADIALFGRMLADDPGFNVEAAAQVAHAISVHSVAIEDDFFAGVDDLLEAQGEETGAGLLGETEFAAGVFYLYVCINRDLLQENLSGDADLASLSVRALVECATKVAPTGKQATFASRAYASYVLAERGSQQPRSLAAAFLEPVRGSNYLREAAKALEALRNSFDEVYGPLSRSTYMLNAIDGTGKLQELLNFVEAGDDGDTE